MALPGNIRYLPHRDIDKEKWDGCISRATNGLIYAYSFYLDAFAAGWDALVYGEYEAVMPLTHNRKFGIRYLYQPFITAQLGVFGMQLTNETIARFITEAGKRFRYIDISLNSGNNLSSPYEGITQRVNYTLRLDKSYAALSDGYSENLRRNIRKAEQAGLVMKKGFDVEKVIQLAVQQMKQQGNKPGEIVNSFRRLYKFLAEKEMATTYGIFSADGALLASCIFFFSHQRAYYILVGNDPAGRDSGASHALLDAFIKDNAGKNMLLDFEGSDIPGLAQFYSSYGAIKEKYPALKINRLPFFLRWLKK